MKMSLTRSIFFVFALSIVAEANSLAAITRGIDPIILTAGSIFAAIGFDALETEPTEVVSFWGKWKEIKEMAKAIKDPMKKLKELKESMPKEQFDQMWDKAKKEADKFMGA